MKIVLFSILAAASFALAPADSSAQDCSPGYFSVDGHEPCTPCFRGEYGNTPASTSCNLCNPGTFTDSLASTACTDCSTGRFSPSSGASVCTDCSAGSFTDTMGSTACSNCNAGFFNETSGATSCSQCDAGRFSSASASTTCDFCNAGTFNPDSGATSCTNCEAGKFNPSSGATTSVACTDCGSGTFSDAAGSTVCDNCSPGRFNASVGQTFCGNCSAGTFSDAAASTACTNCEAGRFNASVGQTFCGNCSAGTFSDAAASTACTNCEAGRYNPSTGVTTCADCSPHTFQDTTGASSCLDCAAFQYQPTPGSTSCVNRQSLQCYKAKDLKNPAFVSQQDVAVSDELSTSTVDVKSPALYCVPAGIDGVVVSNPDPKMCCYKATGTKLATAARRRTLGLELGSLDVEMSKPSLVCEQCGGSVATEQSLQCWKAKDLKNPKFTPRDGVALTTEFTITTTDFKKPALYCAPAAVGPALVGDSAAHQCCYKAKSSSAAPPAPVDASGELGGTFQVSVNKPSLVCEPCTGTAIP